MIVRLAKGNLKTRKGIFKEVLYYDGQKETIAMIMGEKSSLAYLVKDYIFHLEHHLHQIITA